MQRTKCLHVCLHIDWNPYGTFNQYKNINSLYLQANQEIIRDANSPYKIFLQHPKPEGCEALSWTVTAYNHDNWQDFNKCTSSSNDMFEINCIFGI